MPDDDAPPPPTAWGRMIRVAREARRLSIPQAAARAGVSRDNWGHVERGYQHLGARGTREARGNADTVAAMAHAVGITPERLAESGRPDAAEVLAEMVRESGERRYAGPALQRIWEDPDLTEHEKLGIIDLVRAMRENNRDEGLRPA